MRDFRGFVEKRIRQQSQTLSRTVSGRFPKTKSTAAFDLLNSARRVTDNC